MHYAVIHNAANTTKQEWTKTSDSTSTHCWYGVPCKCLYLLCSCCYWINGIRNWIFSACNEKARDVLN